MVDVEGGVGEGRRLGDLSRGAQELRFGICLTLLTKNGAPRGESCDNIRGIEVYLWPA